MQVGEAGVIPSLLRMSAWDSVEAQDCSVGALANLAAVPRCKELIADAGMEALIKLLSEPGIEEHILDMAVGTLANLATLKSNQVTSSPQGCTKHHRHLIYLKESKTSRIPGCD